MAISETSICNMALARIGANRITSLTDGSPQSIICTLHYEQTRDALLRSHCWRFARARQTLSQNVSDPEFEWTYQYDLPNDFLAMISVYTDSDQPDKSTVDSYALEGKMLMTEDSTCEIRYIKQVKDPTQFDPLFVEVLVLQLAMKFVVALAQDSNARQDIGQELLILMRKVRAMDRQETNTIGRSDRPTWIDSRLTNDGRIPTKLGGA